MMEFEKQSEMMDMKEEMMNDAIDDAMGDEDDEEESYVHKFCSLFSKQNNSVLVRIGNVCRQQIKSGSS